MAKKKKGKIPLTTRSGGTLEQFGGPKAALEYRIWVKPRGKDAKCYRFSTEDKAQKKYEELQEAALGRIDPICAVVWDGGNYREVVVDEDAMQIREGRQMTKREEEELRQQQLSGDKEAREARRLKGILGEELGRRV